MTLAPLTLKSRRFSNLCEDFGRCPTQIFAFRNYWPFLLDAKATRGKVAEINKLNERQSITMALGLVPIVVYTKAKMDEAEIRTGSSAMAILETHPMLLLFRCPKDPNHQQFGYKSRT